MARLMARYCAIIGVASAGISASGAWGIGEKVGHDAAAYSLDCARRGNCQHRRSKNKKSEHGMRLVAPFFAALLRRRRLGRGKTNGFASRRSSVSPCRISTTYACHAWMKDNPSPPDQSRWGTFTKLARTISPS